MHKLGVAKLEQGLREPAWATVQALALRAGGGLHRIRGDRRAGIAEIRPKMGRPPKAKGAARRCADRRGLDSRRPAGEAEARPREAGGEGRGKKGG